MTSYKNINNINERREIAKTVIFLSNFYTKPYNIQYNADKKGIITCKASLVNIIIPLSL